MLVKENSPSPDLLNIPVKLAIAAKNIIRQTRTVSIFLCCMIY